MENMIGDTFKCKNIRILYFKPNIYDDSNFLPSQFVRSLGSEELDEGV